MPYQKYFPIRIYSLPSNSDQILILLEAENPLSAFKSTGSFRFLDGDQSEFKDSRNKYFKILNFNSNSSDVFPEIYFGGFVLFFFFPNECS